jgi:putative transposase
MEDSHENVYLQAYTDGISLTGLKDYFEFYNTRRLHQIRLWNL